MGCMGLSIKAHNENENEISSTNGKEASSISKGPQPSGPPPHGAHHYGPPPHGPGRW